MKIIEAPFGVTPVETSEEPLDKFLQEHSTVNWNIQSTNYTSSSKTQLGHFWQRHLTKCL